MQELVITGKIRRAIVVVLDGLRPDVIGLHGLENVLRLARNGASTFDGVTVNPSVTAAAMASLLTGADPARHGLRSDKFHMPRPNETIHPVPRELSRRGLPSSAFMAHVPWLMRPVASQLARALGFGSFRFRGGGAFEVLGTARNQLRSQESGLILLHWPDADRAGHAFGWMSPPYIEAARVLDAALGLLMRVVNVNDPGTLLVALSDHGGGGRALRHHNSDHPLDRTIPIIFAGGSVRPCSLPAGTRLVDVPATILAALGVPTPESYAGVSLTRTQHLPVVSQSVTATAAA
jgi:predicted AlkP superfamily pyrophosphatase or phosphodiesterase